MVVHNFVSSCCHILGVQQQCTALAGSSRHYGTAGNKVARSLLDQQNGFSQPTLLFVFFTTQPCCLLDRSCHHIVTTLICSFDLLLQQVGYMSFFVWNLDGESEGCRVTPGPVEWHSAYPATEFC